jgi:hypothetical protein
MGYLQQVHYPVNLETLVAAGSFEYGQVARIGCAGGAVLLWKDPRGRPHRRNAMLSAAETTEQARRDENPASEAARCHTRKHRIKAAAPQ